MSGNLAGLYDQDTAPDAPDFELIPVGDYDGDIVKAELKDTRAGCMISLQIKLDNGRSVFDNLNIQCSSSQQAEDIAKATVKKIGQTNNKIIRDTSDLELCRVRVRVGIQPARGEYSERNMVKFYQDPSKASTPARPASAAGRTPAPTGRRPAPAARTTPPPAASSGNKPWVRNRRQEPEGPNADLGGDEIPF
ncbi:hypothetical protein AD929_15790 [Gluconobacter potus]|uniref:DUF669 domain-containing protein n=1 Tax=Gluconobacter potus TaxID=2724927 RepID=A0A149QPK6_9PROT|nr:hypothetical protein [Gluconobacter potus]KXU99254.1 hypothetical protein AD929_15790 [Gluconobacter potus]